MRKIYCELHIFDLHQKVYIIDTVTGNKECIAITTLEELPEVINAICDSRDIHKVWLSGNSIFGTAIKEDVLAYAKQHYSWNDIEVEVLK
jgi:hypothetical protein